MSKLMWLFFIPFISSAIVPFLPLPINGLKRLSCGLSLIPLLMLIGWDPRSWVGESVSYSWIPTLSIDFSLKIDSLALLFLFLTAIIIPLTLFYTKSKSIPVPKTFFSLVLLLEALLIGFFTAKDLVLFTVFWEAMLFPLYFLITMWGGERRQQAAIRFLVYMIAGSCLMIAAVLSLYLASSAQGIGTFDFDLLIKTAESSPYASWICAAFLLAFAVKTPLFPFHGWLPDTYCVAPTAGTILLSALLSKAGIYGFLRIALGFFPGIVQMWSPLLIGLSTAGVLYGGLAAWVQNDYKRLIAYSSFSHVNFILVGIFVWSEFAHEGAILQAINHGVTIAGLFMVAGWLEERLQSTSMESFGGVVTYFPQLCWLTMLFVLSSVALPGTNNFIGEFLIFLGLYSSHPWLTAVLGTAIILSVMYMLRWMQVTYFGPPQENERTSYLDIGRKELLIALPLLFLIFWIGIYPKPLLDHVVPAAEQINHGERK